MAAVKPKFVTLGKSKFVHVVRSKAADLANGGKGSGCQQVRKYTVADKINYKGGVSPEAALALDDCPQCHTHDVAQSLIPKPTKADRKAQRDETLAKIKDSTKTGGQRKKEAKAKAKAVKPTKEVKEPKAKKPGKPTKSGGPRSVGGDDMSKAEALGEFAKEHGWKVTIAHDDTPGVEVIASRGDETIRCFFVDGKYDTSRHASVTVGSWTGKLRGVHGCRKQMSAEGRDKPHPKPGQGRSGPRKGKGGGGKSKAEQPEDVVPDDESAEDAKRRVPFLLDDDVATIIAALEGKIIRWRNGTTNAVEQAELPSESKGKKREKIAIKEHPKTGKRILNFLAVEGRDEGREVYGPERFVYLDKIIRVI